MKLFALMILTKHRNGNLYKKFKRLADENKTKQNKSTYK